MNSQLHNQVEVVRTLIDVLQCHNVLMFNPAEQKQTISKYFYFLRHTKWLLILMAAADLQTCAFPIHTIGNNPEMAIIFQQTKHLSTCFLVTHQIIFSSSSDKTAKTMNQYHVIWLNA